MLSIAGVVIAVSGVALGHFSTRIWAAYKIAQLERSVSRLVKASATGIIRSTSLEREVFSLERKLTAAREELAIEKMNKAKFIRDDLDRRLAARKQKRAQIRIRTTIGRIKRHAELGSRAVDAPQFETLTANGAI